MSEIKIACIQYEIQWENISANLSYLESTLFKLPQDIELVVLPEMFNTGFSMNAAKLSESMEGTTVQWMKQMASTHHITILGSIICVENNKYYNRLLVVFPNQQVLYYDKKHLFGLGKEHETYTAGDTRLTFKIGDFKIMPLVCYDLRFPVWSRNVDEYDICIYIANWPNKRSLAWNTLLQARAIENQCYIIGLNRIGIDGNGFQHSGDSAIIHADGSYIVRAKANQEDILITSLSKEILMKTREELPFLKDQDKFNLI